MRAALRAASASSAEVKRSSQAAMIGRSSGQCSRRASGVAKRGSWARSGRAEELEEPRPQIEHADHLERDPAVADLVHEHPAPRAGIRRPVVEDAAEADVLRPDQRLEHRHVQVGAAAGAGPTEQRGGDGAECVGAGQDVGGLEVEHPRSLRRSPLEMHQARRGVHDVGEGGAVPPRPRLAVARDGAVHEVRAHGRRRGVVEAHARHDAGAEVLDDHVGDPHEVQRHGPRPRGGPGRGPPSACPR